TGVLVFMLWLSIDGIAGGHANKGYPAPLASASQSFQAAWLLFRTIGAVVTVPIAEELIFRGFLIRRLISSDFASHGVKEFTYASLLFSSVAFGLLHGDRWIAGTAAGLLYAASYLWRGRIGNAVVAHATTNTLLAICV